MYSRVCFIEACHSWSRVRDHTKSKFYLKNKSSACLILVVAADITATWLMRMGDYMLGILVDGAEAGSGSDVLKPVSRHKEIVFNRYYSER